MLLQRPVQEGRATGGHRDGGVERGTRWGDDGDTAHDDPVRRGDDAAPDPQTRP
ncbi:hypothetical protein [Pseudonocardia sp. KRD291]|uniref:hypothetical protein n=1 Tax=Pseudonocardia sp. KRD291 TaxID=2792007 RepID=UPI001CF7748F|nr:hypothetical protein [Pseudonocardia sp. KRD291]